MVYTRYTCFVCMCTLVGKAWWTYTQSIVKERQGNAKNVWFCQINNKIDILLIIICAYKRSGHNIDNLLNEFIMAKNKINKLLSFNKCTNSHFSFFYILHCNTVFASQVSESLFSENNKSDTFHQFSIF